MDGNSKARTARIALALPTALLVAACGGGGGSAGTPLSAWPSSGNYSVVLKASGSTSASPSSIALSLVHPATPTVEYVIDSGAAPAALGVLLQQGSYDAPSRQMRGLTSVAYVDAPNGTLRTTPLAAAGARPQQALGPAHASMASSGNGTWRVLAISRSVFASPVLSAAGVAGIYASRLAGTQLNPSGSAVLTFVPGQANSLVRATAQVH